MARGVSRWHALTAGASLCGVTVVLYQGLALEVRPCGERSQTLVTTQDPDCRSSGPEQGSCPRNRGICRELANSDAGVQLEIKTQIRDLSGSIKA